MGCSFSCKYNKKIASYVRDDEIPIPNYNLRKKNGDIAQNKDFEK